MFLCQTKAIYLPFHPHFRHKETLSEVKLPVQGAVDIRRYLCPNPQNLRMLSLRGKRDMAAVIQLSVLSWGGHPGTSGGPNVITTVLMRERGSRRVGEGEVTAEQR